jgi:MFS family permease
MPTPGTGEPPAQKALTHRETMWIVAGVLLPVFMGSMDQTVVSSALPTIGASLGATAHLSWVVAANLLTATAMTPLYGKISDIYGRRLSLLVAIGLFLFGSIIAATSFNLPMLIVGRAIQGLGGGGLVSIPMTILGDLVAPKQRARYYTYFSITYITSGMLGPIYGGFISQHLHWSLIFWTNLPLGIASLLATGLLLRRLPRYERKHRLDFLGAALIVLASSSCMFVMNAGGRAYAWDSLEIIGLTMVSGLFWLGFVWRLRTAPEPLVPLNILQDKIVFRANVSNAVGWASVMSLNIYLPMFLQAVHGLSPSAAGLQLVGLMTTVNGSALISAQITARITHYKYPPLLSLTLCIGACLYLALHTQTISMFEFNIVMVLIGVGFGPVAPVTTVAMQNAVQLHQMGIAVATSSFGRSLIATGIIAVYGVIVLGDLQGLDLRSEGAIAANLFGDRAQAADHFLTIFLATAAAFTVSFVALAMMEEKPLQTERR